MSKIAAVTGAASGIGAAACDALGREGYRVIGLDRQSCPTASSCSEWVEVDLRDGEAAEAAFRTLPDLDGLVNNAALQHDRPLVETTLNEWDAVMAVNLRAPFLAVSICSSGLSRTRGSVVNITSVHAAATSAGVAPYAASKGALAAFTRAAAVELASHGVRVNAIAPGAVDTPALRDGFARHVASDPEEMLRQRTPLGRIGQPVEIAAAVAFLLDGERSGFITGETLVVDGGAMARLSTE